VIRDFPCARQEQYVATSPSVNLYINSRTVRNPWLYSEQVAEPARGGCMKILLPVRASSIREVIFVKHYSFTQNDDSEKRCAVSEEKVSNLCNI
jgi:hypothetical protein